MNFRGIIRGITPVQVITTKENKQFHKVSIVCESEERYPQSVVFDVINEDLQKDLPSPGDRIDVSIDCHVTQYNGKYYNNLRAWKISKVQ